MKLHFTSRVMFVAMLGVTSVFLLTGQSYLGGVRGLIEDPGASAIASAKVTLTNTATAVSRATVTNAQGEYAFSQVDPATYTMTVEARSRRTRSVSTLASDGM